MKNTSKIFKKIGFIASAFAIISMTLSSCSGAKQGQDVLEKIKEQGYINMGTSPDFPPNEFYILNEKKEKEIVGSDIALGQAIADKIGVELKIVPTDFNSVLANIQAGQVDMGISGFAMTEERKKSMQFSEGYDRNTEDGYQGILTTKEIADKYKTLEEFKKAELLIGAQAASVQMEMALKLTKQANTKQLASMDALAFALNAGDIDAVVVSTESAKPMLTSFPEFVILPKETFDLDPESMYSTSVIGFPLGDEYQALIEVVNEVIKESRESGDLEKWVADALAQVEKQVEE